MILCKPHRRKRPAGDRLLAVLLSLAVILAAPRFSFSQQDGEQRPDRAASGEEPGTASLPDASAAPRDRPPASATALPQAPPPPATPQDPLLFGSGPVRIKVGLDAVLQPAGVTGSWWNLSEQFAPDANYRTDRAWGEAWIKPGIRADVSANEGLALYSGVSYVGSGNIGKDVFEQGNRGQWSVEDAYIGARLGEAGADSSLDISYGRQPYKIGSGMLISVGAANGFERGATTTFARRAWEEAGLVRLNYGDLSLDGFYLNPNEIPPQIPSHDWPAAALSGLGRQTVSGTGLPERF